MPDPFVPLREWLAPSELAPPADEQPPAVECHVEDERDRAIGETLGDVRRFRAALADVVHLHASDLLREIACDVLARELMEPCDIPTIVVRAIARYACDPVAVRVHPSDVERARACGLPLREDPSLRSGDAVIEVQSGSIDARLGTRLQRVLDSIAT